MRPPPGVATTTSPCSSISTRPAMVFAAEGKDAATVAAFADDLAAHGGDAEAIDEVCIDMSPAFIKGTPSIYRMRP